jgi:hypothetical protein
LNNNKEEIKELIKKSFNEVTPENWKEYIRHVKDIEEKYWIPDNIFDKDFENFIINFGQESDSDTDDEQMTFSEILAENNNNINLVDHQYCKKLF